MKEYKDCFIAFVDLLGFKQLVKTYPCAEISRLFGRIMDDYIITKEGSSIPLVSPEIVKMKVMSDTVCFYIESEVENSLARIIAACLYFQVKLMRDNLHVLTRGAIVKNKIYAVDDITFGPGVIEAYSLEEEKAIYPRIIIDKQLLMNPSNTTPEGKQYIDTYTYEDKDAYSCLDSLFLFYGLCHEKEDWKSFVSSVEESVNRYDDARINQKYNYIKERLPQVTQKYIDYINSTQN